MIQKSSYGRFVNLTFLQSTISNITAEISEDILEWQQRPLEAVYCSFWLDGIALRHNGKVFNMTVYLAVGLIRELLVLWLAETESAAFWMSVLTDMKARGVEDLLINCNDNLSGFAGAIRSFFLRQPLRSV